MSTPWFFISYYRTRDPKVDRHVTEFYEHLVGEMRNLSGELKGLSDRDIGFIDVKAIGAGAFWRRVLAKELWNCRVLVCLYSDGYFTSENCGKEFYAFRSRFPHADGERLSQSVLPVLWSRRDSVRRWPSAVSGIQYTDDALDSISGSYAGEGLYAIKRRGAAADGEYSTLVQEFAARIIRMASEAPPPPLGQSPPFYTAWNAWVDPPAAPGYLEAEVTPPRQIKLSWDENSAGPEGDAPEGATRQGFYVERLRRGGRSGYFLRRTLEHDCFEFTDPRVASGTTYRYRVRAYNAGGPSDYAESEDVLTPGQPPPPMPTDLRAKPLRTFRARLDWEDNSEGRGHFKIERCRGGAGGSFKKVGQVGPGVTTYKDFVLPLSRTYTYRVCASDANGDSDYTEEVAVSTLRPLLLLLLAAAAALAAAFYFRCLIFPSLCVPPPNWSDFFELPETPNLDHHHWDKRSLWDVPDGQWEYAEELSNDPVNKALKVYGEAPGVVKRDIEHGRVREVNFTDFKVEFTVKFLEQSRTAGWIVRAHGDRQRGFGGYYFVLKRPDVEGGFFKLHVYACPAGGGAPAGCAQTPDNTLFSQYVDIRNYLNEYRRIRVTVIARGNQFRCVLMLEDLSEDGESSDPLPYAFEDLQDQFGEGTFGLFADGTGQFVVHQVTIDSP